MRTGERGMTLVELLVMICIVCVLMLIGVVQLLRARARGYETSAVASLRVIAQGQITYSVACGRGGFAPDLVVLGRSVPGSTTPFVPTELSGSLTTMKGQYVFLVRPATNGVPYKVDCNGTTNTTAYYASARPLTYGVSGGTQSFATSLNGVVWALNAASPPTEPFGPPAAPFQ